MSRLPTGFVFSQSNLQDYVECLRRFEARYVERLAWPAPRGKPALEHERNMRNGARFHQMVHQHLLGVPGDALSDMVAGEEPLSMWWGNFLAHGLDGLPESRYPEITLSTTLAGYRLIAKYDLIAMQPGERAVIVDWKTTQGKSAPRREWYADRLQTLVYRYVLAKAGAHLNGGQAIDPEQVEMRYWFTAFPNDAIDFDYSAATMAADEATLVALIEDAHERDLFPLTDDLERCKYCLFQSLCKRGDYSEYARGLDEEADDVTDIEFDFDQIAEIEF